jgi:integrase
MRDNKRTRGTGGLVRKKGSSRWYALFYQHGSQHCVSTGKKVRAEAEIELRKILGRKDSNELPISEVRKLRYENLRDAYLENARIHGRKSLYKPSENGEAKEPYFTSTVHLDRFFAGWKVTEITPDAIRKFVKGRQKAGAANATINRSLAALKRMFNLAIEDSKLQHAPHIELLKEAAPRKGFLEPEQFRRLRQELPERLRDAFTLGYYTGMRLGEIRNLKWEDVDLNEGVIRLGQGETKSGNPRIIPLVGELRDMLSMVPRTKSVFVFGNGAPLGQFRKAWQSACIRAGLGQIEVLGNGKKVYTGTLFHDLRRTAVRTLTRSGNSEQIAMSISGHKTANVFRRYNIVTEDDLKDAVRRQEEYLKAQNEKKSDVPKLDESLMKVQASK